ncbi:MAG TPA: acyl-CoA dehydrogenase family protein [Burkholderiaceae bacterium]|nr:acyl-CoA dehydrogenase family protein [Burkholderiaceae bacterium]
MLASTLQFDLPFFAAQHQELAAGLVAWAPAQQVDESDDRAACRQWVRLLGDAGWLRYCVPQAFGGALERLDSRALVILRETLAFHSPLADFAFAMQGLGSGAITLAGTPEQQAAYLTAVARGDKIAAFALSEPQAGSDVAAMATTARTDGADIVLDGVKTWISNGGIADYYCVFAKTDISRGTRGITAFIVDADRPGLDDSEHLHVMAPHPLATVRLDNCRIPASAQLGERDAGFKLAMQTLDIFRASVAGAALGMARRALYEAVQHARSRKMFGQRLGDFQLTQAKLGDMAALVDAAALLTYRAAWLRDCVGTATPQQAQAYTMQAAMAKMAATENAQKVIDMALQMFGGLGVQVGSKVESLYRDIRSLRIYEGATEVQQLIIGKSVLKGVSA